SRLCGEEVFCGCPPDVRNSFSPQTGQAGGLSYRHPDGFDVGVLLQHVRTPNQGQSRFACSRRRASRIGFNSKSPYLRLSPFPPPPRRFLLVALPVPSRLCGEEVFCGCPPDVRNSFSPQQDKPEAYPTAPPRRT